MANDINLIKEYVPILDEVYARGLLTADLEGNSALVRDAMQANAVMIPKISTQGLADYDRSTGFVSGDANLTWETHTFTQDRGRSFTIDNADNMETAGVAFSALGGDFVSTNVVPETDAYRFATMAGKAGGSKAGALTDAITEIDGAVEVMDDANVPMAGRILYISNEGYKLLKGSDRFNRDIQPGQDPNRNFGYFDEMKIIRVPKTRFYSEITLNDGTTGGQEAGGYKKTETTGKDINFMIVHPTAVLPITKINEPRVFTPQVNQDADAYKFQLRLYHDCFIFENKVDGIFVHTKA